MPGCRCDSPKSDGACFARPAVPRPRRGDRETSVCWHESDACRRGAGSSSPGPSEPSRVRRSRFESRRVEVVRDQRRGDADNSRPAITQARRGRRHGPGVGQDLGPDEGEDHGDRLVEVGKRRIRMSTSARSAPSPRRANAFAVQITAGSRVTANAAGMESIANAMSAATIATRSFSRGRRLRVPTKGPVRDVEERRTKTSVEKEEHRRELSDQLQRERRKLRKMLGRSKR